MDFFRERKSTNHQFKYLQRTKVVGVRPSDQRSAVMIFMFHQPSTSKQHAPLRINSEPINGFCAEKASDYNLSCYLPMERFVQLKPNLKIKLPHQHVLFLLQKSANWDFIIHDVAEPMQAV